LRECAPNAYQGSQKQWQPEKKATLMLLLITIIIIIIITITAVKQGAEDSRSNKSKMWLDDEIVKPDAAARSFL
jgi:heme/copper-type cytochrome/quinol oxidase subunit 2